MLDKIDFKAEPLEKSAYQPRYDTLIKKLVALQQQARSKGVGLVVLFEGWNGAGKGSRISELMFNLDARAASAFIPEDVSAEETRAFAKRGNGVTGFFPFMQQYWKALGERGSITFVDRGWYTSATELTLACHANDQAALREGAQRCARTIRGFERQLVDDGYAVVKFFLHVRKDAQRKRLERLHDDPATRWRVPDKKLASAKHYEDQYEMFDRLLEASNFDFAPWVLVNGEDKRLARLTIAQTLVNEIEAALARKEAASAAAEAEPGASAHAGIEAAPAPSAHASAGAKPASTPGLGAPAKSRFPIVDDYPRIDRIDHSLALDRATYKKQLKDLQKRLFRLENLMYQARIPLMIMYEGWDAAGKGGNIKRVAQALDARAYTIFPSPAPTPVELAHPHLWRYWTRLPKAGHVALYDRSWYGRVLVERVEGFATPEQWARAYDEINEFERDMVEWGAILLKFWVDVSPEEQLRRFEDRQNDPAKQWKITPDDWRNREKYPQYKTAIDDMFRLTSTTFAPWIVLENDDKRHARIKALKTIVAALEDRLKGRRKSSRGIAESKRRACKRACEREGKRA